MMMNYKNTLEENIGEPKLDICLHHQHDDEEEVKDEYIFGCH